MAYKENSREIVSFVDFLGGINDTSTPDHMKDNELEIADNINLNNRGGFSYREGTTNINETSFGDDVMYIIEYPLKDGNFMILAVMKDKSLYDVTDGTKTLIGHLNSYNIDHAIYRNAVYLVDGSKLQSYGAYDYTSQLESVDIKTGDIVYNYPVSTGTTPGTEKHYYRALSDMATHNLKTADYGDVTKWEDVSHPTLNLPNVLREVKASNDTDNDLTEIHKCRYIQVHPRSHRFFTSGNPDDVSCLYFSESGRPDYFKMTNRLYPTGGEGEAKALFSISSSLLVGYSSGWWAYSGIDETDWRWHKIPIPYGISNNSSVQLTPNSLIFFNENGLYKMSTAMIDYNIIVNAEDILFKNITTGKVEGIISEIKNHSNTKSAFADGKFYLAYSETPGSETNENVLVYNFDIDGFVKYTNLKINTFQNMKDGKVYFGSKNYIMHFDKDVLNDVNELGEVVPIKLHVKTKRYSFDAPFNKKLFHRFFIGTTQGTDVGNVIDTNLKIDYGTVGGREINLSSESLIWGISPWGKVWGLADLASMEMHMREKGIRVQAEFSGEFVNTMMPITIFGIAFDMTYLSAKVTTMGQKRLIDEVYTEID
jgi:hypothetical protein